MIWDGNNLFRRSAGNKGLAKLTFKGKPTGAIHGTVKSIITDIALYKPNECVIVFDGVGARASKQKTFAGYKAHRQSSMDEGLYNQMMITRDILRAAGLCVLQKPGIDADDAIGALASIKNRECFIQSNDKDFLSLLTDNCCQIRNLGNGPEMWTQHTVLERIGVKASQIPDYLALCGDGVDGIPGLKGCGPVKAIEFLKKYGTLKNLVSKRNSLPTRWREAVNAQRLELKTFYSLTCLDTKVISPTAMQSIIARLPPAKYSPELKILCETHGLLWLTKWFHAHRPSVVSSAQGLWG